MIKHNAYYELFASMTVPNHEEVGYWVDLAANSKGKIIKVFNKDINKWVILVDESRQDYVPPFIGSNGNWWIDNRDTGVKATAESPYIGNDKNWFTYDSVNKKYINTGIYAEGLSAYQLAVKYGFFGTEEEWLASLSKASENAAVVALEAADKANKATADANVAIETIGGIVDDAIETTNKAEELSQNPPKIIDNEWWIYQYETKEYINTGISAIGDAFTYKKEYTSIAEMEADYGTADVKFGEYVLINTSDVENEDDAKVYLKTKTGWKFIVDLSGMQGIQGWSAYEIAVQNGFVGTEEDWLLSLKQASLDAAKEALAAKEAVEKTEQAVKDAEALRVTAEQGRSDAENIRVSNENQRIANENARKLSEQSRVDAESSRVTEEDKRSDAEDVRISNEVTREANEVTRITAESNRATAEILRNTAETTRDTNEQTRIANESTRVVNEDARKKAEESRVIVESDRVVAESARDTAEKERIANELIRQQNEAVRETQEADRESNTAAAIKAVNDAKTATETATTNAITATTAANNAATNANNKATLANDKATLADQKAILANTAAQNADNATANANSAADNANAKASLADEKAALADSKAILANTAAQAAQEATVDTIAATEAANAAAANANTQADRAKDYADNPPKVGDDGYWYVWSEDADSYVKTGWPSTGLNLKGTFPTLDDLKANITNPEVGDAYMVGSDLYIWNNIDWINVGRIQGPQGEPGKDAEITRAAVENVLTGEVTSHIHDNRYYTEDEIDQKFIDANETLVENYYNKTQIDSKLTAVYVFKGSVQTEADLPTEGNVVGDIWNIIRNDVNVAWTEDGWDQLGGTAELASATNNGLMSIAHFNKLTGIDTNAQVNKIEIISKRGDLAINNKKVVIPEDIAITPDEPTNNEILWLDTDEDYNFEVIGYNKEESDARYVQKEAGKGLSTNDYTTLEKNKLANLENYNDATIKARVSTLETGKADKGELPTKVSQLENDANYINDVSNKVDKITGKSLIADTEIVRLANVTNYNDSSVVSRIGDLETDKANAADVYTKSEVYTQTEADGKFQLKGNYLTSIPDEYVTEGELTQKNYATKGEIPTTLPASDVYDWAKAETKPNYNVTEIANAVADTDERLSNARTPLAHQHIKTDITDFKHNHTKSEITDFAHTHLKSDISDFAHTHTKSNITDFSHTHSKGDITDFPTSMPASDVSAWAKAANKPSYTASEVGALPNTTSIPSKTSDLTNDSKFVAETVYQNVVINSWVSDTTYVDYPFRGTATIASVTAEDFAEIVFNVAEATSGDYAPVCSTSAGIVIIYSAKQATITIPTIIINKYA